MPTSAMYLALLGLGHVGEGARQDGCRGRVGGDDEMARGAEQREHEDRQEGRVQPGDDGRAGDPRVAEDLGNVHRRERDPREHVAEGALARNRQDSPKQLKRHRMAIH